MLGRPAVCTGFSPWQVRVFSLLAGSLPLAEEDGPCSLFHQFSGAWEFLRSVIALVGGDCCGPVAFPSRLEVTSTLPSSSFPAFINR